MTDNDLHWLAGWLEGEGSFGHYVINNKTYQSSSFIIQAVSTDKDALQHVADLLKANITGPYQWAGNKQPVWRVAMARRADVLSLCRRLYPLMYKRRKAQIDKLFQADTDYPVRKPGGPKKTRAELLLTRT